MSARMKKAKEMDRIRAAIRIEMDKQEESKNKTIKPIPLKIPMSEVVSPQNNDDTCSYCAKKCKNNKGLVIHLRQCKEKQKQEVIKAFTLGQEKNIRKLPVRLQEFVNWTENTLEMNLSPDQVIIVEKIYESLESEAKDFCHKKIKDCQAIKYEIDLEKYNYSNQTPREYFTRWFDLEIVLKCMGGHTSLINRKFDYSVELWESMDHKQKNYINDNLNLASKNEIAMRVISY